MRIHTDSLNQFKQKLNKNCILPSPSKKCLVWRKKHCVHVKTPIVFVCLIMVNLRIGLLLHSWLQFNGHGLWHLPFLPCLETSPWSDLLIYFSPKHTPFQLTSSKCPFLWRGIVRGSCISSVVSRLKSVQRLKGHSHAILVHFKNQKYVLTSMNAHK